MGNNTNVKNYTDEQLLKRVETINGYRGYPQGYWILAVRSNEDASNVFDDKCYIYKGEKFIMAMTCTTNSGTYGLLNFSKWNKKGVAVIKSDEWYYDVYQKGLHKGRMKALRQVGPMKYYRDNNKDTRIDEKGQIYIANYYTNFHCNDYKRKRGVKSWIIGGWSVGCVVVNNLTKYYHFLSKLRGERVSMCLIKEF